jgi:hypothetical protein
LEGSLLIVLGSALYRFKLLGLFFDVVVHCLLGSSALIPIFFAQRL